MNILKAMKRSSLGIDFYLWLTYRTCTLKRPLRLSWRQLYRQFGLAPARAEDRRTAAAFRTDCLRELKKIKIAWPGLIFAVDAGGVDPLALEARHHCQGTFSSRNKPSCSLSWSRIVL